MATIDNETLIKTLIEKNGFYEDDPQVHMIVEYTNAYGGKTWGVTWTNEDSRRQNRYLDESDFIQNPKVIWHR